MNISSASNPYNSSNDTNKQPSVDKKEYNEKKATAESGAGLTVSDFSKNQVASIAKEAFSQMNQKEEMNQKED